MFNIGKITHWILIMLADNRDPAIGLGWHKIHCIVSRLLDIEPVAVTIDNTQRRRHSPPNSSSHSFRSVFFSSNNSEPRSLLWFRGKIIVESACAFANWSRLDAHYNFVELLTIHEDWRHRARSVLKNHILLFVLAWREPPCCRFRRAFPNMIFSVLMMWPSTSFGVRLQHRLPCSVSVDAPHQFM